MLRQALSHRSYCSEWGGLPSNERLELLGDAVLSLVVCRAPLPLATRICPKETWRAFGRRSSSTEALAPIATRLGVGEAVLLGKGEESSGGRAKESILADCLEAIIAAVYLSLGLSAATSFVVDLLEGPIAALAAEGRLGDPKNRLQELAARLDLDLPSYKVSDRGPDHAKVFSAEVIVGGDVLGRGTGTSKKLAERLAAAAALEALARRQVRRGLGDRCPSSPKSRPFAAGSRRRHRPAHLRCERHRAPHRAGASPPQSCAAGSSGAAWSRAGRRGNSSSVSLDDGAVLVVHLRMTGQLLH